MVRRKSMAVLLVSIFVVITAVLIAVALIGYASRDECIRYCGKTFGKGWAECLRVCRSCPGTELICRGSGRYAGHFECCPDPKSCDRSTGKCDCPGIREREPLVGEAIRPNVCGVCGIRCPSDEICCKGRCVKLSRYKRQCGPCGDSCPPFFPCCYGRCTFIWQWFSMCRCPSDTQSCGDMCIDTSSDEENCGGCGIECAAGETCDNGLCHCDGACGDLTCCMTDMSGTEVRCVDLGLNGHGFPDHCAQCRRRCGGETPDCCYGTCVNLAYDEKNCKDCGATCSTPPYTTCCGSCVDTSRSFVHCGKCDNPCPEGLMCCNGNCHAYPCPR